MLFDSWQKSFHYLLHGSSSSGDGTGGKTGFRGGDGDRTDGNDGGDDKNGGTAWKKGCADNNVLMLLFLAEVVVMAVVTELVAELRVVAWAVTCAAIT